jgi:serine/threonine protein kinase
MSADRNLLYGVLAVQMHFISREQLVAAMHTWVLDKTRSLGQLLVEGGALPEDAHCLLDAVVQKHLQMHGGDPHKSLASVQVIGIVRSDLQRIADPDLGASLSLVPGQPAVATPQEDQSPSPTADTRTDLPARASRPSAAPPATSGVRFRVIRTHARGGLGEVFAAHDEQLDREVALKEIQLRYADDPDRRARFLLEGRITGKLEHPGIVPVYGLGCYPDGRPFYAMRFIKGESLQDAIRHFHAPGPTDRHATQSALELRQLLGRFLAVCNAVAYAHSRGVIHRDIKPANVMLGEFGETLVVDWGLAKLVGQADGTGNPLEKSVRPASASDSAATRMGSTLGTPHYMSPEQAAGRLDLLGPRSDVYSLGATLYHLLTGQPPFEGSDVEEVLRRVQTGELLPPRRVKSDVPAALEAVCLKAMALEPEERYDSAQALAGDIEKWLADEPVSAWREPWDVKARRWVKRHRTVMMSSVAALLVASITLGVAATFLGKANNRLARANNDLHESKEAEERAKEEALEQRDLALRRLQEVGEEHERAFFYLRSLVNLGQFGRSLSKQPLRQDFGLRIRLFNAGNPGKVMLRGTIASGDFDSTRPFLLSVEATCDCHLHVFYAIPPHARVNRDQPGGKLPPILCLFPNKEETNSLIMGSEQCTLLSRPGLFLSPVHTKGELAFLYVLATERDWECRPDGNYAGFYSFSESAAKRLAKQIAKIFAEADNLLTRQRIAEEIFVFSVRDDGK